VNFLNPLFLFSLAAASIPVIIHLFTRRRPREVRFPSLEFLSEVNQSEIRRLKIKQWLLLLLRTLAVAALALAMSRPALRGTAGPRGEAATTVVVLLDRSGSMSAGTRGGSLFADARRTVEDLLTTLGPGDELLLIPYDDHPQAFTPKPVSDLPRLRGALQSLTVGARTTNHVAALEQAGRALAESHALNRELFWLSDFQASGATDSGTAVRTTAISASPLHLPDGPWDRARAYLIPFAPASRANAGLTEVSLAPAEDGAALSVTATAYGIAEGDLAVEVREGERSLGRGFLPMPARGEATTLLPLATAPAEGGVAILPDDALPLDNRRVFAAGPGGTLHVLLREDGVNPSPMRLALEAGSPASGLEVETVSGQALASRLTQADVLVIHDVDRLGAVEAQAALDFHRAGGAILLVLGSHSDAAWWNATFLPSLGAGSMGALENATGTAAWRLMRAVVGHPVLAGFSSRPGEPLSSARFQAVRAFTPTPDARVLLAFDRAHPALIEAPHALVFAAPLDPGSSDFAVSGAFLPLLHQAVKVLGRGTAAPSLAPGDRYSAPAATGQWRIVDESGREIPSQLEARAGSPRLVSDPIERTGLYRVSLDGRPRTSFAVNPDPRESDLEPLPDAALTGAFPAGRAQILRPGADLARRVREARYGRELWPEFLILALILLVAESILGRWGMTAPAPRTVPARSA
jgi:hypothetical protein